MSDREGDRRLRGRSGRSGDLQRVFKPPLSSSSLAKLAVSTVTTHELWAHSNIDIENTRFAAAGVVRRCGLQCVGARVPMIIASRSAPRSRSGRMLITAIS